MAKAVDTLDLGALGLAPGEARSFKLKVALDPFKSGGQRYQVEPSPVDARVEVSRTIGGWALHLAFDSRVGAPCARCLKDAEVAVGVDAREVEQPGLGEELHSPYLVGEIVDARGWAHDALILAMPARVLCRDDCRGLCAVCGADLNESDPADHTHDSGGDLRWAKLDELRFADD